MTPSLSLCNESYFLIGLRCVMCDEKWILHANWQWPAQWLDQKEAPRHFPKPTKKKKKKKKKGHGHCLVVCCPFDPLQLSESSRNHCIWEVCSVNQWDAHQKLQRLQPALINRKGRILFHDNTRPPIASFYNKVKWIELQSFVSSATFTWPLANWLPLPQASWQLLAGKMLLQPAGDRKCFPRVHLILKHGFLHYGNKQTFLIDKNVLIFSGFYFD